MGAQSQIVQISAQNRANLQFRSNLDLDGNTLLHYLMFWSCLTSFDHLMSWIYADFHWHLLWENYKFANGNFLRGEPLRYLDAISPVLFFVLLYMSEQV